MTLTLYRRHRLECEAGKPEDSRSTELDERRKDWGRKCQCQIHMSGTLGGVFSRKATGMAAWDAARPIAAAYEEADSWTGAPRPRPAPSEPPPTPVRVTLSDACTVYLTHKTSAGLAPATLRKYRTFTTQITAFAERRGYVMLDQFTYADIDVFWANWKLGARAKGKRLTTLRGFFRFCVNRKWIAESPVGADIKPPVGSSRAANKMPFTDEELERILTSCDRLRVEWKNDTTGVWTGENLKDLIWLMVYTGLRISDATFFEMTRLQGDERDQVFLRATKNGGDVFAYIPDWLRDRLLARAARCGQRPFIIQSERLETVTNVWRRRIAKAFELAGPFSEPATPHRFRHTFARILLQKGVPVADVADLLGDDEQTVREHYARWVPERRKGSRGFSKTPSATSRSLEPFAAASPEHLPGAGARFTPPHHNVPLHRPARGCVGGGCRGLMRLDEDTLRRHYSHSVPKGQAPLPGRSSLSFNARQWEG